MTVQKVAEKLGCHPSTVRRLIWDGVLKSEKGENRNDTISVKEEDLDEFMKPIQGLITKEELARLKGVSTRTVESWVLKGTLVPVVKFLKRNYFNKEE